jgi:arginase family enzyme
VRSGEWGVCESVDYRMPGGLWPGELSEALAAGLEITICNPTFDDAQGSAARALARAVTAAFAKGRER